jgi:hypothetical protein
VTAYPNQGGERDKADQPHDEQAFVAETSGRQTVAIVVHILYGTLCR